MPFDPKVRRASVASAPRPAPKGSPQVAKPKPQLRGDESAFVSRSKAPRTARGVGDPSRGHNDESIRVINGRRVPAAPPPRVPQNVALVSGTIPRGQPVPVRPPSRGSEELNSREALGHLGPERDPVALLARYRADQLLEDPAFLHPGRGGAPRPYTGPVDRALVHQALNALPLSASQKETLQGATASVPLAHRLEVIVSGSEGLSAAHRATLLSTVAADPKAVPARLVEHLVASDSWKSFSVAERSQLVSVLGACSERGMRVLTRLAETRPEALRSVDGEGQSLLSNLERIAQEPRHPALAQQGLAQSLVLQDVLRDITNPGQIDQGRSPTCTVTSMQFELARDNPAEYGRLMDGLTGASGTVTMAGRGALNLQLEHLVPRIGEGRSTSEAIFQSAAMEFANGAHEFVETRGHSLRGSGSRYEGLYPSQQKLLLKHLFGAKYSTERLESPAQAEVLVERLRTQVSAGPNRPVLLEIDEGAFNHVVTFEKISAGQVHYRDPYGHSSSMSEAAFRKHVVTVHLPSTLE